MVQLVLVLVICNMCLYLYSIVDMTPTKELDFFFIFFMRVRVGIVYNMKVWHYNESKLD